MVPVTEISSGAASPVGGCSSAETEFTTASGRRLRLACEAEEVIAADGSRVGVRISPTVIDLERRRILRPRALTKFDATDFWEIDRAVLQAARPLLERPERPVIVPISFHSMSRTRARQRLFDAAEMSAERNYTALVAEIVGADQGTPSGRLTDAINLVRPLASAVFIEVLGPTHAKQAVLHPVAGLTLDVRSARPDETLLLARLAAFEAATGGRVRTLLVRGLPSSAWRQPAAATGITHVSIRS